MSVEGDTRPSGDEAWRIIQRWLEYEGEARANVLRLIAIGVFYLIELINFYGLQLGFIELPKVVDVPFHTAATCLAVAWTVLALGILYCQTHRFFPAFLSYGSVTCDAVLMTAILMVARGPSSPLVVGYFLIIALSALRFNLPLVWLATVSSMAGYVVLLGYAKWYAPETRVPRYHQLILLAALALSGIVVGQVIRRFRDVAEDYAARVADARGEK